MNSFAPSRPSVNSKLSHIDVPGRTQILATALHNDTSPVTTEKTLIGKEEQQESETSNNVSGTAGLTEDLWAATTMVETTSTSETLANDFQKSVHLTNAFGESEAYAIQPEDYLNYLESSTTSRSKILEGSIVIPLDIRPVDDFRDSYIKKSININLPNIILRRLKQKTLANFTVSNFLTSPASHLVMREYQTRIKTEESNKRIIFLIFDDGDENETNDSELWGLVKILYQGLAGNFMGEDIDLKARPTSVAYLCGGFSALSALELSSNHIVQVGPVFSTDNLAIAAAGLSINDTSNQGSLSNLVSTATTTSTSSSSDSPMASLNQSFSNSPGFARRAMNSIQIASHDSPSSPAIPTPTRKKSAAAFMINTASAASPTIKGKKRSLSVITAQSSTMSTVPPSAKIFVGSGTDSALTATSNVNIGGATPSHGILLRSVGDLKEISEFQVESPCTPPMSAVTAPFSIILPNLILGSDAIPTSKTAADQLKDLKVTHILNMAADVQLSEDLKKKFEVHWFRLEDHADQEIESSLKGCCRIIGKFCCKIEEIQIIKPLSV